MRNDRYTLRSAILSVFDSRSLLSSRWGVSRSCPKSPSDSLVDGLENGRVRVEDKNQIVFVPRADFCFARRCMAEGQVSSGQVNLGIIVV